MRASGRDGVGGAAPRGSQPRPARGVVRAVPPRRRGTSKTRNGGRSANGPRRAAASRRCRRARRSWSAFGLAAVRVAVHDERHRIAADRLFEAARSEERIDLERLAFDGLLNRRVVQQRDRAACVRSRASAASSFSASSTASCTNCLMIVSPQGPSARVPKPPPNPFTPAMPTPCISHASPSSTVTPRVGENLADLGCLARFEIVIAEHRRRSACAAASARAPAPRASSGEPVVGEIAGEQQHVGRLGDAREQRLKRALRRFRAVQIADRGDADHPSPPSRPIRVQELSQRHARLS